MDVVHFVHYFERDGKQVRFLNAEGKVVRPSDQEIVNCQVESVVEALARLFDNQRSEGPKSCYLETSRHGKTSLRSGTYFDFQATRCELTFAPEVRFVPWKGPTTRNPTQGITLWRDPQGTKSTATRDAQDTMRVLNGLFGEDHQPNTQLRPVAKSPIEPWSIAIAAVALLAIGGGAYSLWKLR